MTKLQIIKQHQSECTNPSVNPSFSEQFSSSKCKTEISWLLPTHVRTASEDHPGVRREESCSSLMCEMLR